MSTCYYPLRIVRDSENKIVFTNEGIPSLPCGQCLGCRLNHAEGWAIRMVHEAQLHEENSFLTLTYDNDNLPVNGNLHYRALTLFIKRLRKALSYTSYNEKLKYYAVGEYGEKFSRPHYHVVLFGFDFSSPDVHYKGLDNVRTLDDEVEQLPGKYYYRSTFLDSLWPYGRANIGDVNYHTCMYVAKYVTKKVNGRDKEKHYQRVNELGEIIQVEPERAFMSRRNAIGKQWLEKYLSDVYPHDSVIHDGKRLKVPRYYDKYLEKTNPDLFNEIKLEREQGMIELAQRDQKDLTRIHNVKLLKHKNHSSNIEGVASTNDIDEKLQSYWKRINDDFHLQQKEKKC